MTNNFLLENFKHLTTTPENVEQLKKLVLQMAVQGKLTAKWREDIKKQNIASPDDPNYNAHALLEKIKIEKEQLIKEGKIKRQKPLPPIVDEEKPFELPESWEWVRLDMFSNYGQALKIEPKNIKDQNIWVLELEDIEKITSRLLKKVRFIERQSKSTKSVFQKGDVLYGKLRPYLDKVIVADEDGVCTTEIIPIKIIGSLNPYFIRLTLKRSDFLSYVDTQVSGMRMPRLKTESARSALIPLPPLAEQQAIVTQVEKLFIQIDRLHALAQKRLHYREKSAKALFSKINTAENDTELQETWQTLTAHFQTLTQSKESVKQLRQSILQMAVQGKLTAKWRAENPEVEPASVLLEKIKAEKEQLIRTKKIKKLKYLKESISRDIKEKVPQKWVITKLGNVISYRKGKKPNILVDKKSKEYCIPYIDIKAFEKNIIAQYTNEENVVRCSPNDILIVWDGARMGLTGTNATGALGSTLAKIEYYGILKDYLYIFLKSKYELINSNPKQAGLPHVNPGLLENMEFMFPCDEEQKAIVSKVQQLMAWCDELEKKIEKRDAYQERMMQAVVKQAFKSEGEAVVTE